MKLGKDIETIKGLPVAYIRSLSALVCSDPHLGYESARAKEGSFIPKRNLQNIKEIFAEAAAAKKFDKVIITGDVKNDFSALSEDEFNELRELVFYLRKDLKVNEIWMIKGNHDNFVDRMASPINVKVAANEFLVDGYLFVHGDSEVDLGESSCIIMGHIHPSIAVYNDFGVKEKLRCFLNGKTKDGRDILVLPSMNFFSAGMDVNIDDVSRMAPIFRDAVEIDDMHALCIGDGEVLDFGTVGQLRKLAQR